MKKAALAKTALCVFLLSLTLAGGLCASPGADSGGSAPAASGVLPGGDLLSPAAGIAAVAPPASRPSPKPEIGIPQPTWLALELSNCCKIHLADCRDECGICAFQFRCQDTATSCNTVQCSCLVHCN